jgi:hypothetical protein
MAVHAEKSDAVAGLHSGCAQRTCQELSAMGKLRVGESQIAANDRCPAWKLLFRVAQTSKWCEWDIHVVSGDF